MLLEIYKPEWAIQFDQIKEKLLLGLSGIEVNIEHIGSTAVIGLTAKPIIDIDIIFYKSSDFEYIKQNLQLLGYFHNGNQGVEGREVFKRNGINDDEVLDKISHHLYVCKQGCDELQRHLLFRDYLRKHDIARNFYQKMKYLIAEETNNDRKLYANLKEIKVNSFINYIIELSKSENQ